MSRPAIGTRDRRVLLGGVVCLAGLVLTFRGVPAFAHATSGARASARQLLTESARARGSIAALSSLRQQSRSVDAAWDSVGRLVTHTATTAALIGALSTYVGTLADSLNIRLMDVRPESVDSSRAPLVVVTFRTAGEGDVEGVVGWLRDLETGRPLARVVRLRIDATDPQAPPDRPERLRFDCLIELVGAVEARR